MEEEFERIKQILSNELNEDTIEEIEKMTKVLEAYTDQVNITNERLERLACYPTVCHVFQVFLLIEYLKSS